MTADLLTIAAIARELDLPESTIRYYRDRFVDYVPSVGSGRGRRYPADALAVLRFVADNLRSNVPADEVEAMLRSRFAVSVSPQQQSAATQQQSAAVMRELLADALRDVLAAHDQELRTELAGLRTQLAELTTLMEREETGRLAAQLRIAAVERERDDLAAQLKAATEPHSASREAPGAAERADVAPDTPASPGALNRPWWKRLLGL